jgi:pyrroline-5-carboxylate reductase
MTLLPSPANPMLLFGCGNMGRAMLDGWLAGGIDPAAFVVVDPYAEDLPTGVGTTTDRQFSIALLAIKPQMFAELSADFEALLAPDALVISILAGTQIEALQAKLPGRPIIRLMPNLAAALGKSPLGLFPKHDGLEQLLAPLGKAFWLDSEQQMDAVTALAGSGPAFVYRFIDALAAGGTKLGLSPQQALGLATSMGRVRHNSPPPATPIQRSSRAASPAPGARPQPDWLCWTRMARWKDWSRQR